MAWKCKRCGAINHIYQLGCGTCKVEINEFNKKGNGINDEIIDLEMVDFDDYTCDNCGNSASNIEDIAEWVKEE